MNPTVLLSGAQGEAMAYIRLRDSSGNIKSVTSLLGSLFSRTFVELGSNSCILKIKDPYCDNLVVTFVCA